MSWPTNQKSEEMYEFYNQGFSLAQVARKYGVTRQSVYGLFKYRNWCLREKTELPYTVFEGSKYTMRNNGYYGKTCGKRTLLHRDVWKWHEGEIPRGYDIHHRDGDKTNNSIENLECLPKAEHTRKYSPHHNQYTKGQTWR